MPAFDARLKSAIQGRTIRVLTNNGPFNGSLHFPITESQEAGNVKGAAAMVHPLKVGGIHK